MTGTQFDVDGSAGLHDRPGRGRRPSIPPATVGKVVAQAGQKPPGKTRWSTRSMARHASASQSTVSRIWRRNGLKAYCTRTFKLSYDKHFARKFWDVIGPYLNPPENAVLLCRRPSAKPWSGPSRGFRLESGTSRHRRTTTVVTGRSAWSPR